MILKTRHFGEVIIDGSEVIKFEEGLPGFEHLKDFALLGDMSDPKSGESAINAFKQNDTAMFLWLQSLEESDVAFVLINTYMFLPDYSPKFEEGSLECLGQYDSGDLIVRNIAVIPEKIENITANLCAPIVINFKTSRGKQALTTNKEYHVRHLIIQEAQKTRKAI